MKQEKIQKVTVINIVKYLSEFLAHIYVGPRCFLYKKHLGPTGTPTNVQNNCIKLSGFGVDITRLAK